ncbi:Rab escort protein, putative [Medicago truncatula]|uniref:Rab escort protein, putative n=1 Tax=Medicago truncatula TaxID=3880 RepID=G7JXN5_MEDTR|nr:Rab escort protein, putative [Medicago truncatula]
MILLYSISMVDFDQENGKVCKDLLNTKDRINRLARCSSSVGSIKKQVHKIIADEVASSMTGLAQLLV